MIYPGVKTRKKHFLKSTLLLLGLLLFFWTFSKYPLSNIFATLKILSPFKIGLLLLVNILIEFTLAGRWWFFLKNLDQRINYVVLNMYKIAAMAISYITPGPQFGGEPFLLYVLKKKHHLNGQAVMSSIVLDRLLEVLVNFTFISGVSIFLFWGDNYGIHPSIKTVVFLTVIFIFPIGIFYLYANNKFPVLIIIKYANNSLIRLGIKKQFLISVVSKVEHIEKNISLSLKSKGTIALAFMATLVNWIGLVGEFWLLYVLLNVHLSPVELLVAVAATRVAFLTPIPAGLGALEASQILALKSFGIDPAFGISACLIIRARDMLVTVSGLLIAKHTLTKSIKL